MIGGNFSAAGLSPVFGSCSYAHRDVQRDHAGAERRSAVVATGDLQNDVNTQNAAATAEGLWD